MGKQFEVGHSYRAMDGGFCPITVIKRTAKSIRVTNDINEWMMRIRVDKQGNEFVIDSAAGPQWREAFTFSAIWEEA